MFITSSLLEASHSLRLIKQNVPVNWRNFKVFMCSLQPYLEKSKAIVIVAF